MKIRFYKAGEWVVYFFVGALLSLLPVGANAVTLTELERKALVGEPLSLNFRLSELSSIKFSQLSSHCLQANLVDSTGQQRQLPLRFRRTGGQAAQLVINDSAPVNNSLLQVVISSSCPLATFSKTLTILPKVDRVVLPAVREPEFADRSESVSRFSSNRSIQLARTFVRPSGDAGLSLQTNRNDTNAADEVIQQNESNSKLLSDKNLATEDLEKASQAGLLVKAQMPSEKLSSALRETGSSSTPLEDRTLINEQSGGDNLSELVLSTPYERWLFAIALVLSIALYATYRLKKVNKTGALVREDSRKEPSIIASDAYQQQANENGKNRSGEKTISPTLLQSLQENFLVEENSEKGQSNEEEVDSDDEHSIATNYADNLISELTRKVVEVPIEKWQLPEEVLNAVAVDRPLQSGSDSESYRVRTLLSLIELSFRKAQTKLTPSESEVKYLIQVGFSDAEISGTMTLPIIEEFIKCRELELSSDDEINLFLSNVESIANYFPEGFSEDSRAEWQSLTTGTEFAREQSA